MCECTACRNLGNSVDVCCQCCSCSAAAAAVEQHCHGTEESVEILDEEEEEEQYGSNPRRFEVRSVALTGESDDTLEVCLNDYEEDEIAQAHHSGSRRNSCRECKVKFRNWSAEPSCCNTDEEEMVARHQQCCYPSCASDNPPKIGSGGDIPPKRRGGHSRRSLRQTCCAKGKRDPS